MGGPGDSDLRSPPLRRRFGKRDRRRTITRLGCSRGRARITGRLTRRRAVAAGARAPPPLPAPPAAALSPRGPPPQTGGLLGSAAKAVVVKRALALLRHLK